MASVVKKLLPGAAGTAGAGGGDDDFNLVTHLYQFDGSNGGQNNTFIDSSSNNLTVTAGSDVPAQGTFSPFSADEGKWSVKFTRATPDYISPDSSSDFAFGTGDFTIECWCYLTGGGASGGNGLFAPTTGVVGPALGQWNTNGWQIYTGTSETNLSNTSYPQNEWVHVAFVRASNVVNLYQNGVKVTSDISDSTNYTNTGFNIGWYYGTAFAWDGYISNFRIVKGTAVYTSNFDVPTEPLTAITNTKLLTCCSNRFRDKSTSAHSFTTASYPKIQPFSPFKNAAEYNPAVHGGSFLFEKNANSSLSVSHATLFDFGTADYCIEAWLYPTQTSFSNSWAMWASTIGVNQYWAYTNGGGNQAAAGFSSYPAGGYSASNSHILKPFEWSHCVFQNTGGYENWYLNGTQIYDVQNNPNHGSSATGMMFGRANNYASYFYYGGYMSDVRVTTGANYNPYSRGSTITVPTAPLTSGSYTRLLLNGTNAAMIDQTGNTNIETIGNAQLNTSIKKFGTASAKFDETDDRLLVNNVPYLSTGDFTIEGFVYFNSSPTDGQGLFVYDSQSLGNRAAYGPALGTYASTGKWHSYHGTQASTGTGTQGNSEATPSATTWIHFAYVRTSGVIKIFINGTQIGSDIAWTGNYIANDVLTIGGYYSTAYLLNGYIDSYRVTLKARYTSNFDVPTEAFPNI